MRFNRLHAGLVLLFLLSGLGRGVLAQVQTAAGAASGQAQFPGIPLKRDAGAGTSITESAGWAALFLAVVAGAAIVVIRRKTTPGGRAVPAWLRSAGGHAAPKALGRVSLTQQASLHVVQWRGEELLLGCTPQSVSVLARCAAESGTTAAEAAEQTKGQG